MILNSINHNQDMWTEKKKVVNAKKISAIFRIFHLENERNFLKINSQKELKNL